MLLFEFAKFTLLSIIFMHLLCQSDQTAELAHGSNGVGDSFKSGGDLVDAASDLVNEANEGVISDDLAIDGMKKASVGVMCNDAKFELKMDHFGKLRNDLCKQLKSDGQNFEVFLANILNIFTNVLPAVLSNAINEIEKKALLNEQNVQNVGTFRHNFNGIYETIANNANIFNCHHHQHHKMLAITAKNGRRRKRAKNNSPNGDIEMGHGGHNNDHDEGSSSSGEGSGEGGKKCHCSKGTKWALVTLGIVVVAGVIIFWAARVLFSKDSITYIGPEN